MKRSLLCGTMLLLAAIFTCGQVWGAEARKVLPVAYETAGGEPDFLMKIMQDFKIMPLPYGVYNQYTNYLEGPESIDSVEKKIIDNNPEILATPPKADDFIIIDLGEDNTKKDSLTSLILFKKKPEKGEQVSNRVGWYSSIGLATDISEYYKKWLETKWTLSDNSEVGLLAKTKNAVANNCVIIKCLYRYVDNTDLLGITLSEKKTYYTSGTDPVSMNSYKPEVHGEKLKDESFRFYRYNSHESFFCRAFVFAWDKDVPKDTNILWFKLSDIVEAKTEKYKLDSWTIEGEKISKSVQKEINFTTYQMLYGIAESFKKEGLEAARQKEQERLAAEEEKKKQEELKKKSGGEKQEEKDPVIPLAESLKRLSQKA